MRRALVVLLIATVCSLQLTPGVARAGDLKVSPNERREGKRVEISGKTGCKKKAGVHVRALRKKINKTWRRAIRSGKVKVRANGRFSMTRRVRKSAVDNESRVYTIVSHCKNAKGKRSGKARLRVLPFSGLPVLPQLLLGLWLIGGGAALLRGGRERTGPSRRQRRRAMKPLPVSQETLIARRAPKAD